MKGLVAMGVVGSLLLLSGCGSEPPQAAQTPNNTTVHKLTGSTNNTAVNGTQEATNNTANSTSSNAVESTNQASAPAPNATDNSTDSQSFLPSNIASNDPLAPAYFQVTPAAALNASRLAQAQDQGQPTAQTILNALEISAFKADQAADQSISLTNYNGPQISLIQVGSTSTLPIVINMECNGLTNKSQVQPFVTWLTHFAYSLNQWMFYNKQMQAIEGFTLPFPTNPGESDPAVIASTYVWLQNTDGSNLEINYVDPAILNTPFNPKLVIRQPEVFLFGVGRMPNYPVGIGQQASMADIEKIIVADITWPSN